MQPSPMAETCGPLRPSVRIFIGNLLETKSRSRAETRAPMIAELPALPPARPRNCRPTKVGALTHRAERGILPASFAIRKN